MKADQRNLRNTRLPVAENALDDAVEWNVHLLLLVAPNDLSPANHISYTLAECRTIAFNKDGPLLLRCHTG